MTPSSPEARAQLAALLQSHPLFEPVRDDTASPTQRSVDRETTRQRLNEAERLADWLMARGVRVERAAAPPFGPDAVVGPTSGTPLSDIAKMAVDLGPPNLSSTFRARRNSVAVSPQGIEAAAQEMVRCIAGYPVAEPWGHMAAAQQDWYRGIAGQAVEAYLAGAAEGGR